MGQVVSFGNVVVSVQGIASGPTIYYLNKALPNPKPPWQLPWQAIPYITAMMDGLNLPRLAA